LPGELTVPRLIRLEKKRKIESPSKIVVSPSKTTVVRLLQLLKALFLIVLTRAGIVMLVRLGQL
jgi:hypothetical protein